MLSVVPTDHRRSPGTLVQGGRWLVSGPLSPVSFGLAADSTLARSFSVPDSSRFRRVENSVKRLFKFLHIAVGKIIELFS